MIYNLDSESESGECHDDPDDGAGWTSGQQYILAVLEAFDDRDFKSGEGLDGAGNWHPGDCKD